MRNAFLAAAVLMLATGCGAYHFPSAESPSPTGTVSGTVVAIPCAPVEKAGQTCSGRPVANLELDYSRGQSTTAHTVTDAKGNYSIDLPAGTYAVKPITYMRVISGPIKLTVGAGTSAVANYVLDSGIRVPIATQPSA